MKTVRIYCGDDSVDIVVSNDDFLKLQNFIHRQQDMQLFEIR